MRPFDAVTLLRSLGLEVAGARAVPGDPGLVIDTDPAAGTSVEPGSAVTLLGRRPGRSAFAHAHLTSRTEPSGR